MSATEKETVQATEETEANRARTISSSSTDSAEGRYRRGRRFSEAAVEVDRTVVVAVDASDDSKFAFEWFVDHIYHKGDHIVLVHCPELPKLPTFTFKSPVAPPVEEWKTIMDEANAKTRRLEEDYEQTCIENKLKYKVRGETMKNPGEGIVKIAEEEKAEMIVMGTRGLGKIKRALLGSVSDYVVRNALLPVIIVPSHKKRTRKRTGSSS